MSKQEWERLQIRWLWEGEGARPVWCPPTPQFLAWFHPRGFLSKPSGFLEPRPRLEISSYNIAANRALLEKQQLQDSFMKIPIKPF